MDKSSFDFKRSKLKIISKFGFIEIISESTEGHSITEI